MNSCIVKQDKWGQQPELRRKITPSVNDADTCVGGASRSDAEKAGHAPCVIEQSNDMDTCIGGASRRDAEKAGSVHTIDSRLSYETEVEKRKFIRESF